MADAVVAEPASAADALRARGVTAGGLVGVAHHGGLGVALATERVTIVVPTDDPVGLIGALEGDLGPRWVWWSNRTAVPIVAAGVHVARCWDVAAVHRLLAGGWRADPALVWAWLHDLDPARAPTLGQLDLLTPLGADDGHPDHPVRPDGYLRPEWVAGAWADSATHLAQWAATALEAARRQAERLAQLPRAAHTLATARSESAAELLCAELERDGLPVDVVRMTALLTEHVGPRPASEADAEAQRARRDTDALRHAPAGGDRDLRNPAHVRSLLRRVGIDVPDTRAWRLEAVRDVHPFVGDLLAWRKAERLATTYGYAWLDAHVGADGRLRGAWSGSDGAAGRMTAQAGLHNLPAELREAIAAEPGYRFVRADLGQIEPRVLAAISGDPALVQATADDDLYAPVARRLGVERSVAKVAVLAAMYGQTSGTAGQALRGLEAAYPVAMGFLSEAEAAGRAGRELRTVGGRLVRMWPTDPDADDRAARAADAARGRYARNAMVQGAAAELFKAWAATVRAMLAPTGARIVLCLHDELLVHAPDDRAAPVAQVVEQALRDAAARWSPVPDVRFVAEVSVVHRWSEAK